MDLNSTSNATLSGENIFFGVSYLVISIMVVSSNGVVVSVIFKSRELHMPTLWMITFMAICDFATGGLFLLTATPTAFLDYFPYPDSLVPVVACMLVFIGCQNVFNICMVVIDRYIAIRFPMKYPRIAVTRNYLLLIVLSLMVNICHLLIMIFTVTRFYFSLRIWYPLVDQKSAVVTVLTSCVVLIPFSTVIICSVPIYKNIRRAHKRVTQQGEQSVSNANVLKFPLMVLLCAVVFCISYIPFVVTIFWKLIYGQENVIIFRFAILSWLSNSIWNVFIYAGAYKPFKEALIRLFCIEHHRHRRRASMLNITLSDKH